MGESKHTPGPWEYIPSTQHHGPYVVGPFGDVADCYTMSNPMAASARNGGTSYPVHHQGDSADANARLIAAAPELLEALKALLPEVDAEIEQRQHGGNDEDWQHLKALSDAAHAVVAQAEGK